MKHVRACIVCILHVTWYAALFGKKDIFNDILIDCDAAMFELQDSFILFRFLHISVLNVLGYLAGL